MKMEMSAVRTVCNTVQAATNLFFMDGFGSLQWETKWGERLNLTINRRSDGNYTVDYEKVDGDQPCRGGKAISITFSEVIEIITAVDTIAAMINQPLLSYRDFGRDED